MFNFKLLSTRRLSNENYYAIRGKDELIESSQARIMKLFLTYPFLTGVHMTAMFRANSSDSTTNARPSELVSAGLLEIVAEIPHPLKQQPKALKPVDMISMDQPDVVGRLKSRLDQPKVKPPRLTFVSLYAPTNRPRHAAPKMRDFWVIVLPGQKAGVAYSDPISAQKQLVEVQKKNPDAELVPVRERRRGAGDVPRISDPAMLKLIHLAMGLKWED